MLGLRACLPNPAVQYLVKRRAQTPTHDALPPGERLMYLHDPYPDSIYRTMDLNFELDRHQSHIG